MTHETIVVMGPPLSSYPTAPSDQSKADLHDCPFCKNKMWLSVKKKKLLIFHSCLGNEIILGCYECIKKFIEDNQDVIGEIKKLEI